MNFECMNLVKRYSLQEYVLVDSESTSVEIYRRREGKMWLCHYYEAGEAIALESIEFQCPIELLYEGFING